MIGVSTSTVCPSATSSALTVPAYGLGSSTTALAVSISTRTWLIVTVSPGLTCQDTMSASVRPSPTSGSLNSLFMLISPGSEGERAVDRVQDAVQVGQVVILDPGHRVGGREPADAQYRGLQMVEALLGHPRGDLRAESGVDGRLVRDHAPSGPRHRCGDGRDVDRRQRAE